MVGKLENFKGYFPCISSFNCRAGLRQSVSKVCTLHLHTALPLNLALSFFLLSLQVKFTEEAAIWTNKNQITYSLGV